MRLGRYHLSDCLGGGPTGEVYRAKVYGIAGLDRDFAVKRFHPSLVADAAAAARLQAAAGLYGALEHPRVARLHEIGEASGHLFIATEFVSGTDLGQLIEHGRLPLGTAAQLIVQVARAVGYAHGRGFSHLGLCPTNILCTVRGDIKVTDFGFLPARLPPSPATDPNLLARLCYLAPEQLEAQATSPATDVYQLGVLAYLLMAGRKPYPQKDAMALSQAMLNTRPAPSGLDKPFDKLLMRALARSPFERFPDAGALADALEAAVRTSPVPGSLAEAGKAVSKRQSQLLAQRDSEASGALSFPMPAPPLGPVKTPPPPVPGLGARTRLGMMPPITSRPSPQAFVATPAPFAGDTDVDAAISDGRAATYSDMVTIPEHELIEEAPELSENIELGPAGTAEETTRGQFIGGQPGPGHEDEAQTLIRDKNARRESIDESETIVKRDGSASTASAPGQTLGGGAELAFEQQAFDDLEGIEDEISEQLPLPSGAPLPVEVPQLPTAESGPFDKRLPSAPRELPPPQAQRLPPPGQPQFGKERRHGGSGAFVRWAVLIAILGAGAFFGYGLLTKGSSTDSLAAAPASDASSLLPHLAGATDAGQANAATVDAGGKQAATLADAASLAIAPEQQNKDAGAMIVTAPSDALEIASNPSGAQIYLDGTLVGKTPIKLDASDDSHRIAVILPGYDLYDGDIVGRGLHTFDLAEVDTLEGPYGIKVRCVPRNKGRYYIYVDQRPVGQLCPSERIGVEKGKHEIEIYDPITDSRRVFNVVAESNKRSLRVLVD